MEKTIFQMREQLRLSLQILIDSIDGAWEADGFPPSESSLTADCGVWIGEEIPEGVYTFMGEIRTFDYDADVVLHFDGAGNEFFSYNGFTGECSYRQRVVDLAASLGFYTEDHNSWSMGFYYLSKEEREWNASNVA